MSIRIVLGDDHAMLREGLVALLRHEPDIEVLGQAGHGLELLRLVRELHPDVVIADVAMPHVSGIAVARRMRNELLPGKVLCLSVSAQLAQVTEALEAGAAGYVLKENCFEELARAIRHAFGNQIFLSSELVAPMMNAYRTAGKGAAVSMPPPLTWREREVVQLFAEGCSTQQVANRLHISAKTVATHRAHVFYKLNIHSLAELTRFAVKQGMTPLD